MGRTHKNKPISFLEDRDIKAGAERKLRDKKLDMIVANTPAAIGSRRSDVLVKKCGDKWLRITKAAKRKIAGQLIRLIEQTMRMD
jgi:phosphopantothenoylcysteine synthetase/decarboxylase